MFIYPSPKDPGEQYARPDMESYASDPVHKHNMHQGLNDSATPKLLPRSAASVTSS